MVKSPGPMPSAGVAAWAVAWRRLNRHEETAPKNAPERHQNSRHEEKAAESHQNAL